MRRCYILLCCLCCSMLMVAQEHMMEKINEIKLDSTCLYGEATLKTQADASALARKELSKEIAKWAKNRDDVSEEMVNDLSASLVDSIVMKRANMMRVFVYVKKTSLLSVPTGKQLTTLDKIIAVTSFFQLKEVMEPMYEQGIIKSYGKYNTMSEPSDCYLVIYDPDGDIRAVLGKGIKERKNLSTGLPDSEHNYSGCGAIWFQLND